MSLNYINQKEDIRRAWQDPEGTLRKIGLRSGNQFADIGCGYGFFTLPAARLVGNMGKVYAVDINESAIEILQLRLKQENLEAVLRIDKAEHTVFCDNCMDIVFFSIVLHDFQDQHKVLKNARRMIKNDGVLVNLDWKNKPLPLGPPLEKKFSTQKTMSLIEDAGFQVTDFSDKHKYLYMVIARPKEII
jgi:ubiquinone/menaquinone biosynthesis C-methylase UbiE